MSKNHPEGVGVKDIVGCLLWLCEKICNFKNCDKNDIIGSVMRVRRFFGEKAGLLSRVCGHTVLLSRAAARREKL